jgi:hypothetical protein
MRLSREAFEATSGDWGPSKRGAASQGLQRDRAERAKQRETRQARREKAGRTAGTGSKQRRAEELQEEGVQETD